MCIGAPFYSDTGRVLCRTRESVSDPWPSAFFDVPIPPRPELSFGYRLDMWGDYLLIGAPSTTYGGGPQPGGSAFLYRNFTFLTELVPIGLDTGLESRYGEELSLHHPKDDSEPQILAVGAPWDGRGAVYLFQSNTTTGLWEQVQRLNATGTMNPTLSSSFGFSVDLSSDGLTLMVGDLHYAGEGRVLEYTRPSNSSLFSLASEILSPQFESQGQFASVVRIHPDGNSMMVSQPGAQVNVGRVWRFRKEGSSWLEQDFIDGPRPPLNDFFGAKVEIVPQQDGDVILVTSPQFNTFTGAVYAYQDMNGTWVSRGSVDAPDVGSQDHFGYRIASSGSDVFISALGVDSSLESEGVVFMFRPSCLPGWLDDPNSGCVLPVQTTSSMLSPAGTGTGLFGKGLAFDGSTAVVGQVLDDSAVYVYERQGQAWARSGVIEGTVPGQFGSSLTLTASQIVVASWQTVIGGPEGRLDFFNRSTLALEQTLMNPLGPFGNFAESFAIHNSTLAVGAPRALDSGDTTLEDSVFLYELSPTSGDWELRQVVNNTVPFFGSSLAIDGDTLAIGNPRNGSGTVHVFHRSGGDDWSPHVVISGPSSDTEFAGVGALALSEDLLVVGSRFHDLVGLTDAGSVHVYSRHQGGSNVWGEVTMLISPTPRTSEFFGRLQLSDEHLWVSSYKDSTENGRVYVYSVTDWGLEVVFDPPKASMGGRFGDSIALGPSGSAFLGSPNANIDRGAVFYVDGWCTDGRLGSLEECDDGNNVNGDGCDSLCRLELPATSPDLLGPLNRSTEATQWFGFDLARDGDTLVVGALGDGEGGSTAGAVFVYTGIEVGGGRGAGVVSNPSDKLVGAAAGDFLGHSVAVKGEWMAAGAYRATRATNDAGLVYVYRKNSQTESWEEVQVLEPPVQYVDGNFGHQVSMCDNLLVVGAWKADGDRGAVYAYTLNGTDHWDLAQSLFPSDPSVGDVFGSTIGCSEHGFIAVGAWAADGGVGKVYVFEKVAPQSWVQASALGPELSDVRDTFGQSLAVFEDEILIGDPAVNRVHLYKHSEGSWNRTQLIIAPDDDVYGSGDFSFGSCLDLDANSVVVGAKDKSAVGGVYLFSKRDGGFVRQVDAESYASPDAEFGHACLLGPSRSLFVGSHFSTGSSSQQGDVFVFDEISCGDEVLALGLEACDDGNLLDGDGCSAECLVEFCGDGSMNNSPNEECDDGNVEDGDGCDSSCQVESSSEPPPLPLAAVGGGLVAVILLAVLGYSCLAGSKPRVSTRSEEEGLTKSPSSPPTVPSPGPAKTPSSPPVPAPPTVKTPSPTTASLQPQQDGMYTAGSSPPPARPPPAAPRTLSPPPGSSSKAGDYRSASRSPARMHRTKYAIMTTVNKAEVEAAKKLVVRLNSEFRDDVSLPFFFHVTIPKFADGVKDVANAKIDLAGCPFFFMGTAWGYNIPVGECGMLSRVIHLKRVDIDDEGVGAWSEDSLEQQPWVGTGEYLGLSCIIKLDSRKGREAIGKLMTKVHGADKFMGDMESKFVAALDPIAIFRVVTDEGQGGVDQSKQPEGMARLSEEVYKYVLKFQGLPVDVSRRERPLTISDRGSNVLKLIPMDVQAKLATVEYDTLVAGFGDEPPRGFRVNVHAIHRYLIKEGHPEIIPSLIGNLLQLVPSADQNSLTRDEFAELQSQIRKFSSR